MLLFRALSLPVAIPWHACTRTCTHTVTHSHTHTHTRARAHMRTHSGMYTGGSRFASPWLAREGGTPRCVCVCVCEHAHTVTHMQVETSLTMASRSETRKCVTHTCETHECVTHKNVGHTNSLSHHVPRWKLASLTLTSRGGGDDARLAIRYDNSFCPIKPGILFCLP